ncbi:TfoX/Sxy family protein [Jiella sonneratiae]|uniref:TfoX/Sxy family protein n=1 Tax=Jiella sonneratiae TaxID=2816856 RepID=A0ABS3IZA0_9HYPH|nr:TfoX/Sxy family protein [Jiella sonneratiae]MBO0902048.1 TfoX/Sxy family protein [Jiella sonneratiae]
MDEAFLQDLFGSLGGVAVRRMFGGQGIYSEGRIVALVIGGVLHLKGDGESEATYTAAGLERWCYARPGRAPVAMPYWRFPEAAFDDPEEAERWIAVADAAARRAALAQKPRAGGRGAKAKRPAKPAKPAA